MRKSDLPAAPMSRRNNVRSEISESVFAKWNPGVRAAAGAEDGATISILDPIGQDYWTGEGVTARRIEAALRSIGRQTPVTVSVNSPGGDMFEGLAIYNLFREHEGEVTMKVIGIAASAASVIAMAGDRLEVPRAGFLMIHNAWVVAAGDRHELKEVSDWLEPFDSVMADIYAARSGMDHKAIAKLMDAETFIGGQQAVDDGFADALLSSDEIEERPEARATFAARRIESALRAAGMSKRDALELVSEFKASSGDPGGSGAGDPVVSLRETAALAASLTKVL